MRASAVHAAWIMQMWTKQKITADRLVKRPNELRSFDSVEEVKAFAAEKREG